MKRIALVAVTVTVAAVAGTAAYMKSASGQSNGDAAPRYFSDFRESFLDENHSLRVPIGAAMAL